MRAFAQLGSVFLVFSAKVNVAVIQVVGVQQLAALRHDLIYQLFGSVKLVIEGCLLPLHFLRLCFRSVFILFVLVCFQIGLGDFGIAFSAEVNHSQECQHCG